MRVEWPLIGRDQELRLVAEVLTDGRVPGVVLGGQAGVGKSRLAHEAIMKLESRGWSVYWTLGTEEASAVPLGAFASLLAASGQSSPTLASALAAFGPTEGGRRVVLVDDAHLLDRLSLALLQQLLRSKAASVIATIRTGHPRSSPLVRVWKEGMAEYIELQPLARIEMRNLLTAALGAPVEAKTFDWLWKGARGNPLFLKEYVLSGIESGSISEERGVWYMTGPLPPGSRLHHVVETRLTALDAVERDALQVLAVAERLDVSIAEGLIGADSLEQLERRDLIVIEESGERPEVRLSHPVYGEVVRATMPAIRMRRVKGALVEAFESRPSPVTSSLKLALWRLESDKLPDPGLFLAAARHIMYGLLQELAAGFRGDQKSHVEVAFESLEGGDPAEVSRRLARAAYDAGQSLEAGLVLVEALNRLQRLEEARQVIFELRTRASSPEELAYIAFFEARLLLFRAVDATAADVLLAEQLETTDSAMARAILLAVRGEVATWCLNTWSACLFTEKALVLRDAPDALRAYASLFRGLLQALGGATRSALETLDASMPPLSAGPEAASWVGQQNWVRQTSHLLGGRLGEARTLNENAGELIVRLGGAEGLASNAFFRGLCAIPAGSLTDAVDALREAAVVSSIHDTWRLRRMALAALTWALAQAGETARAREALQEMEETPGLPFAAHLYALARSWVRVAEGDVSGGAAVALAAAEDMRNRGVVAYEALLLHEASRLGRAGDVVRRLEVLARGQYDASWASALASFARGAASEDGKLLDDAAEALEECGALLWAAEAAVLAGASYSRAGLRPREKAARNRAALLISRCQHPRTPILHRATEPESLSPREREVARLAAQGISDKAIAERLVLSVRTVQTHLYNAYGKLGAEGRSDLAKLLGEPAPAEVQ